MAHSPDLVARLLFAVARLRVIVPGFTEADGYVLTQAAASKWTQAQVRAVERAWFLHGAPYQPHPENIADESGRYRYLVTEIEKQRSRERADAMLDRYAAETGTKPRRKRPPKTVKMPTEIPERHRRSTQRHVFSPFSFAGADPSDRYVKALRELRQARSGFDARDGYKLTGPLSDNQKRSIRRAFNNLRRLKTQPHSIKPIGELSEEFSKKQVSTFLKSQGQYGKGWRQAILRVPDVSESGRPVDSKVVVMPDDRLAIMARDVVKRSFRFNAVKLLIASEEGDVYDYVFTHVEKHAPGADSFKLNLSNNASVWTVYRTADQLARAVEAFFENEEYGEPEKFLEGYTALWNMKPEGGADKVVLLLAAENDRRIRMKNAKRYWAHNKRIIKARTEGYLHGFRISPEFQRQHPGVEAYNDAIQDAGRVYYMQLYSQLVDKAVEQNIMTEQELYNI